MGDSSGNTDAAGSDASLSARNLAEQEVKAEPPKAPIPPGETWEITDVKPRKIWNDQMVTVSFRSSSPKHDDWIAAYSPPNANIKNTVPVKYGFCDDFSKSYNTSGELT